MEEKLKTLKFKKKLCALLTAFMIIFNMFSPYGALVTSVQAAEPAAGEPYFLMELLHPGDASSLDPDCVRLDRCRCCILYAVL